MRAIATSLLLCGCTVIAPDPARDSGPVADSGEPCARALAVEPLGAHPDRVLCPAPALPTEPVRAEVRAMLAAIAELERRYCEEERARVSSLSADAWERELAAGGAPGSMPLSLSAFGVARLERLPREPSEGCTPEERATEWIARHRALWGLAAERDLRVVSIDAQSAVFEQRWRGLPVAGASLAWRERLDGVASLEARLVPTWAMPASALPDVSASEALALARDRGEPTDVVTLTVWPAWEAPEPSARLAWRVGACVVDARDGSLVSCPAPEDR